MLLIKVTRIALPKGEKFNTVGLSRGGSPAGLVRGGSPVGRVRGGAPVGPPRGGMRAGRPVEVSGQSAVQIYIGEMNAHRPDRTDIGGINVHPRYRYASAG